MKIDYVRVYQVRVLSIFLSKIDLTSISDKDPNNRQVGCSPDQYPTEDYIKK